MIQAYHNQSVSQTYYPTKNVVPTQLIPKNNIDIPIHYIHTLTKKESAIFLYLFAFHQRISFKLSINQIANMSNCSLKTVQRATNKFHNQGSITKFQQESCFDLNQFTIDFKKIGALDESSSLKMSDININSSLFINSNSILSISSINIPRATEKRQIYKKEIVMEKNQDLFTNHGLQLTSHGEIYIKYVPLAALEYALNKLKNTKGINDVSRFVSYHAHEYCKANKLAIEYPPYFRSIDLAGIDKKSDLFTQLNPANTGTGPGLKKQVKILETVIQDPDKDLKEKLDRVILMAQVSRDKIKALEEKRIDGKLTISQQTDLDNEYFLLRTRNNSEMKYKLQLDQNRILRNENSSVDMSQTERDYRSLYLKMDRDASELNTWKVLLSNPKSLTSGCFVDETVDMANKKILILTRSLAKDLEVLNELDIKRQAAFASEPPTDNTFADLFDQSEIH